MNAERYASDGQGTIYLGRRVIGRDEPSNVTSGADISRLIGRANALDEALDLLRRLVGEADSVTLAHGGKPGTSDRWTVTAEARRLIEAHAAPAPAPGMTLAEARKVIAEGWYLGRKATDDEKRRAARTLEIWAGPLA